MTIRSVQDDVWKGTVAGNLALIVFVVKRDKFDVQEICS